MGIPCRTTIAKDEIGWRCHNCHCDLVRSKDYIPGDFTGRLGDAVFVHTVVNIEREPPENQLMRSGRYVVQYVKCKFCHEYLGWAYVKSFGKDFRYKEGKFCLETHQITGGVRRGMREVAI